MRGSYSAGTFGLADAVQRAPEDLRHGAVPISDRSVGRTAQDHPDDRRGQHEPWDRLHDVRVASIVAAFVLVLAAATSGGL